MYDEVKQINISIHAPHARSDFRKVSLYFRGIISIHAPHARSDDRQREAEAEKKISIHAPHARSDFIAAVAFCQARDFNPRSSCEERPHLHLRPPGPT